MLVKKDRTAAAIASTFGCLLLQWFRLNQPIQFVFILNLSVTVLE